MNNKQDKSPKPLKPLPVAGELAESDLSKVAGGLLKIDGVDGESTDDKHKGTIEIESWSVGTATTVKKP